MRTAGWTERVKKVMPKPLWSTFRTVAQPILSKVRKKQVASTSQAGVIAGRTRHYLQADNWVKNRYTFVADRRLYKCFFITGCYKSGTNWVQNIFNLHPDVNCTGEFHFEALWHGYESFISQPWFLASRPRMKIIATDSMQDVVRRMMYAKTRDKPQAMWLGDRTPRKMIEFLPGAPMINIHRDGRDLMVSWNFHHLRLRSADRVWKGARAIAEQMLPRFHANPEAFEQPGQGFLHYEPWFRHHARVWGDIVLHDFKTVPVLRERGTPVLQLSYTQLHQETAAWRSRFYHLLDLDESRAQPMSWSNKTVAGFSDSSPRSFYRKGAVGEWRDYFDEKLSQWFREEAGEALLAAGYEKTSAW